VSELDLDGKGFYLGPATCGSHAVTPPGRQIDPTVGHVKPFLHLRVREFYISRSVLELLRELSTRVPTRVKYESSYESSYESFYELPGVHYKEYSTKKLGEILVEKLVVYESFYESFLHVFLREFKTTRIV
jgi:hypothetical protein